MRFAGVSGPVLAICILAGNHSAAAPADAAQVIPKTWDEADLAEWPTPIAAFNVRPTHLTPKENYALPVENLRTYPVYFPGREPEGYWDMLQRVGPQPMIEPEKLKTETGWIDAGRRIFEEADQFHERVFDPKLIALARRTETFDQAHTQPLPDGTLYFLRWVPTKQGLALSLGNCNSCHLQYLPDGTRVPGAPSFPGATRAAQFRNPLVGRIHEASHVLSGDPPFVMGSEPLGMWLYQAYGVPWAKDDIHERLKTVTAAEYTALLGAFGRSGGIPRWNGSIFYPAKIPDLIGIRDRKYIDHTATHLHRGVADLMRYAALVTSAEPADFGAYHVLLQGTRRVQARLSDEALYALALYLYSLTPPSNPNGLDEKARAGQRVFAREGCPTCHTPPLYTSNKLTLATGFAPPREVPAGLDILRLSVGTDPGLALSTRKGTGYYKVPSLRGVWYRGHYLHDGSLTSLEEMFDPGRLNETHVPGGFLPSGEKAHAIRGHEFGLKLKPEEREQLIAFLRTL
jgi:mono/diheme cytochrome c family protein